MTIALDTNILARLLLNDDAEQFELACDLLSQSEIFTAPPTVLLELVWVLRVNDCSREEIASALRGLFGLPNFQPREPEALLYALRWFEAGLDFGDALHLALSASEEMLRTFDKRFVKKAARIDAFPVVKRLGAS